MSETHDAPNFFVLGAAKCGTTTLYHLLRQHPQIFMTRDKEPRFFDTDQYYEAGLDKYLETHFSGAVGYPARGEATPFYLRGADKVASRIREDVGSDVKFIAIMRDPVERAWSHYLNMLRIGAEREAFSSALRLEPQRVNEARGSWIAYYADGLYASQLEVWFRYFPRERFLLLLTEDLRMQPEETARRMFEFLSVDPDVVVATHGRMNPAATARYKWLAVVLNRPNPLTNALKHLFPYVHRKQLRDWVNQRNKKHYGQNPELDPLVAVELRTRYHDDVRRLEKIMGRDLSHWFSSAE